MDKIILPAQVVAAGFIAAGLFGLLVISIPSNRSRMFGDRRLGVFQVVHGYLTLSALIACGVFVWVRPSIAMALAVAVCLLVLIGKAVDIANGQWRSCKRCVVVGPLTVLFATALLVLSLP